MRSASTMPNGSCRTSLRSTRTNGRRPPPRFASDLASTEWWRSSHCAGTGTSSWRGRRESLVPSLLCAAFSRVLIRRSISGSRSATLAMVDRRCCILFLSDVFGCGLRSGPSGRAVAATCCISGSCAMALIRLRCASGGSSCRSVSWSGIAPLPFQPQVCNGFSVG